MRGNLSDMRRPDHVSTAEAIRQRYLGIDTAPVADVDGAIVIPAALAEQVLAEAGRLTATEIEIRAELDAGATLEQVLTKYGHV